MEITSTLILSAIGIGITVYYSWHSQKMANDKMLKELFYDFNKRYNDLNDHLSIIEDNYSTMDKFNDAANFEDLKHKILDYFNLCAEEFYWYHHKHRIDKLIWDSWHSGMMYWFENVPAIKTMWEIEVKTNGKISYYIIDNNEFFKR